MAFLIALALAATEPPEALRGGLSPGLGTAAYDAAGVRGEIGTNHFGVYAGWGVDLLSFLISGETRTPGGKGFSFGARWYHGVPQGWFAWFAGGSDPGVEPPVT